MPSGDFGHLMKRGMSILKWRMSLLFSKRKLSKGLRIKILIMNFNFQESELHFMHLFKKSIII
jgi:hypothetical protein